MHARMLHLCLCELQKQMQLNESAEKGTEYAEDKHALRMPSYKGDVRRVEVIWKSDRMRHRLGGLLEFIWQSPKNNAGITCAADCMYHEGACTSLSFSHKRLLYSSF